jgi:mannosylglycerate hydrolase
MVSMYTGDKALVIVVSHTHWDREWYLTFEGFRYHLVSAMDRTLELLEREPDYKFMLDGQVIPLLDYLAIRPEREEKVKKFVRAGRLLIGPWYAQPDEFLASGEALIRNLLLGYRIAQQFGSSMPEGYIPDTFGHIAQLPQILCGFGIETAFITRGADLACDEARGSEFRWRAPDGSEVFTHVFELGYCSGAFLAADPTDPSPTTLELRERGLISKQEPPLIALLHALQGRSKTRAVLLMNGCDHLAPQEDVLDVLRELNGGLSEFRFRQGTLSDYARLLRTAHGLPEVAGEFRVGKRNFVLPGVLSTRMYLKQRNFSIQTLLERYAEPLAAFARPFGRDLTPFVQAAWELVLQNQAHDSICGTGVDPVHREMMVRYDRAETIAQKVVEEALVAIGALIENSTSATWEIPILVFNPCPWEREVEVAVAVTPRSPDAEQGQKGRDDLEALALHDPEGKAVPFAVVGERLVSEDVLKGAKHVVKKVISFPANLPPLGFKLYRLVPGGGPTKEESTLVVGERTLENEFCWLQVRDDGTLDLLDKQSGRRFSGLGFLEDVGDAGDEYTFSPSPEQVITSQGCKAQVRLNEDLPWRATLRVDLSLRLPKDRLGQSELVEVPVTGYVSLGRGQRRVEVSLEVENNARDHRLRVGFPSGIRSESAVAEDTFWVARRAVRPPNGEGWVEEPPRTHPQKSFMAVEDDQGGIAILNRGLPEYEVTEEGTVYLTLLRCVGWLSRDDLVTRRGHAGPPYATPEAQCPGRHRFEFALLPYRGTWEEAQVWKEALSLAPPIGQELAGPARGELPAAVGFLQVEGLPLSAVKPAEEGEGIVVRLYNPTDHPVQGQIRSFWPLRRVTLVGLDERASARGIGSSDFIPRAEAPLPHSLHSARLMVPSGAIITVKLSLGVAKTKNP